MGRKRIKLITQKLLHKIILNLTKHSADYGAWKIASANFANQVSNGSTVFAMQNINGVSITSTWATIEYPILEKKAIEIIYEIIGGI